jgi:hypothetical protein
MNKILGLCFAMLFATYIYGQKVTVSFCASVEQNGYCNFNNTKFITSQDSTNGRVFMEVRGTDAPIGATKIIFKVYKIDKAGGEKFSTMLQQDIKPDWFFAWMPNVFESPGKYAVKIYNESDQLICTNSFELIPFK